MRSGVSKIELAYDSDCPNVEHARGYGSPTILIDEHDVAGDSERSRSCRLYDQGDGTLDPAPSAASIIAALRVRT